MKDGGFFLSFDDVDLYYMGLALKEAKKAYEEDEVPIGAVIVGDKGIIGKARNRVEATKDPTAHAEILAIREAALKLGNWRLTDSTLYVTVEPCIMCAGAIVLSRISRLVFGVRESKFGAAGSLYSIPTDKRLNHTVLITEGILEKEAKKLLSSFFSQKRDKK